MNQHLKLERTVTKPSRYALGNPIFIDHPPKTRETSTKFLNPLSKTPIQDQNAPKNFRNFRPLKGFLSQVVMIK
jgi:hypothetical protein